MFLNLHFYYTRVHTRKPTLPNINMILKLIIILYNLLIPIFKSETREHQNKNIY